MIAIRIDEKKYEIGDYLPESRVWEDSYPTDKYLSGTSTLITGQFEFYLAQERKGKTFPYAGQRYIVDGIWTEDGQDAGEVVLRDCRVVAIIEADTDINDYI